MRFLFPVFIVLSFAFAACNRPSAASPAGFSSQSISAAMPPPAIHEKINGLTFVAPPEPFPQNPMTAVKEVGAGWIAVVPYAFTRPGDANVQYHEAGGQWWGEKPAGVRETIRLAHENGIKVMLKPQVWIPRGWTGSLSFST
ncbi:MAG: hypothetical protein KA165_13395, partial [Saprospiraceae bacterium]|nr:hypothetical protein [Saprospiraceae bacterium]